MNEKYKHFPACHVVFPPKCEERRAAFYLAAEEYVAETFNEGNYIFTWQLSPTCVFGRNQIPHSIKMESIYVGEKVEEEQSLPIATI